MPTVTPQVIQSTRWLQRAAFVGEIIVYVVVCTTYEGASYKHKYTV